MVYATGTIMHLLAADYGGAITSINLHKQHNTYNLTTTHTNHNTGPNPSWLDLGPKHLLFSLNEGLNTPNGSISSLTITANQQLQHIETHKTISGPVSSTLFQDPATGAQRLTVAHYSGSAVTDWSVSPAGHLECEQQFHYQMAKPGPDPDRQDAPHPHEALPDPTGHYVLVPDLGADVVRVFAREPLSLRLVERTSLVATPGSGPRHAAFRAVGEELYFYLVSELASTVTGYRVTYPAAEAANSEKAPGDLLFKEVGKWTTFGNRKGPVGNAPAEIAVTPDNRFLIVSNRNDSSFEVAMPYDGGKKRKSDSLAVFTPQDDGSLTFLQLAPAGGRFPRHFSLSPDGALIGVGLQTDRAVAVLRRDIDTGLIGEPVAGLKLQGEVTCVVWDE